jgi:hypothetical protein
MYNFSSLVSVKEKSTVGWLNFREHITTRYHYKHFFMPEIQINNITVYLVFVLSDVFTIIIVALKKKMDKHFYRVSFFT